jgi:Integrase core domain
MGVMPSLGSVADAYANAMAESFFATLEREVLQRRTFKTQAEARMAVVEWIKAAQPASALLVLRLSVTDQLRKETHHSACGLESNDNWSTKAGQVQSLLVADNLEDCFTYALRFHWHPFESVVRINDNAFAHVL